MKYPEISRKLADLGCQERKRRGGGSHRKWFNPHTQQSTVVPDKGSRDLSLGIVRAIVRQLGIEWQDFQNT